MMRKYMVIAKKWDEEANDQIEYVAGEFNTFVNANIFKRAYREHTGSEPIIVSYNEQ